MKNTDIRSFIDIPHFINKGRNENYRKIGNNTYAVITSDEAGNPVCGIQLHQTVVAAYWPEQHTIQFTTGGWNTVTTWDRINWALNLFALSNVNRVSAYSDRKGKVYTFYDKDHNPIDMLRLNQRENLSTLQIDLNEEKYWLTKAPARVRPCYEVSDLCMNAIRKSSYRGYY